MTDQRDGGIAWTDETWNVVRGCSDVNTDCINCYAKNLAARRLAAPGQAYHGLAEMRNGKAYWTGKVDLVDDKLLDPLGWTRPRKVFVNAMSDLFHEQLTAGQIDQVVAVMASAPIHTFQVLTKRPKQMALYLAEPDTPERIQAAMNQIAGHRHTLKWPLPNVWWGASMGHQAAVMSFMPHLLACRKHAAVLWISAEPLTERITFEHTLRDIDWLVVGGESGKDARPMHPAWPKALQRDAGIMGVAFHFKQWGEWLPITYLEPNTQTTMLNISCSGKKERIVHSGANDHHDDINMVRVGKLAAGRLLEGKTWDQWPISAQQFQRIG